ncbi:hypothetical protein LIER_37536 [Lithospermum erythrorhizon]|uniref:Pentatricopeptide repeat-containing protein n=1 Tax=Lithospermum erythrorhizon TaxID=34254 RepID=A0AAV3PLN3_LITER
MSRHHLRITHILSRTFFRKICTHCRVGPSQSIGGFSCDGNLGDAVQLFDKTPVSKNVVAWNLTISAHIKDKNIKLAQRLFDQMPLRDTVSWNTMLSGFRDIRDPDNVYKCFLKMRRIGDRPNELTVAIMISAVLNEHFVCLVPQLHCFVYRFGLNVNAVLGSAVMRGYIDLGNCMSLCKVFDEILEKEVTPWNVLILGYMEFGFTREARSAFDAMPEKSAFSWSTLINGYLKNNELDQAWFAFNEMSEKDVFSWTAMIKGCVQSRKFEDAFDLFVAMMKSEVRPNHYTFSSALDACSGCSSLIMGNQVHACILKLGTPLDVILATSLIDMYAKCGDVETACHMFDGMRKKNLASWNAVIGGCARCGLADKALVEFDRMVETGIQPDGITFINVLSACVHGGTVEEGERIFASIESKYSIRPALEHYACMVDLYGRAGQLNKAKTLIEEMPYEPDVVVWGALLGACGLHSSLQLGETAANGIYRLQEDHPATYDLLSKMHGESGVWTRASAVRQLMKIKNAKKQNARSWIDAIGAS